MMAFAVCLDTELLLPRAIDLGTETLGLTLAHGTLLAGLTWLVTRLPVFRQRPALTFALWALALLKFFLPSGPAFTAYGPSNLLEQAARSWRCDLTWLHQLATSLRTVLHRSVIAHPLGTVGGLALLAYGSIVIGLLARWLRTQRRLSQLISELPLAEPALTQQLVQCAKVMTVRAPLLRITEQPWSPLVVGCFRPTIVLPRWLLSEPTLIESVLLHELGHLHRRDLWSHQLQRCAEILLFFWPVIHWVTARLRESRELACDALVLAHSCISAQEYGTALLRVARLTQYMGRGCQLSAAVGATSGGKRLLQRRIAQLLQDPTRERWSAPAVVGFAAWALLALSGAQASPEPQPSVLEAFICHDPQPVLLANQGITKSQPRTDQLL